MGTIKRKHRPEPVEAPPDGPFVAVGPPLFGRSDGPRLRVLARDKNGKPTLQGVAYRIAGDDDD